MGLTFQGYAANIKPALDAAFDGRLKELLGTVVPGDPEGLGGLSGGKKIRGILLCMVGAALGGTLEVAMPRAVAVELIQTATLIHDDFVDRHRTRRGLPALWLLEGPRRAVLVGDVIFSSAIRMMSELGQEDCRIVSSAISELACGACQEPLDKVSLLRITEPGGRFSGSYEKIVALKTGILFASACELGALAAGADEAGRRRWWRYGMKIGEAYQLADDLHEMERGLGRRAMTADELVDLVPALLHFAPQSAPKVRRALHRQEGDGYGELLPEVRIAADFMKTERKRCLQSAIAELDGVSGNESMLKLARRTPRDLIGMFDAAATVG